MKKKILYKVCEMFRFYFFIFFPEESFLQFLHNIYYFFPPNLSQSDFLNHILSMFKNEKCSSCENAKSTVLPRPSKTKQVTYSNREVDADHVFEAGIVSTDLTGPYSIKSFNENFRGSQTFMLMDSKKTFTFGYKNKNDSINNLKRLVEAELKPKNVIIGVKSL